MIAHIGYIKYVVLCIHTVYRIFVVCILFKGLTHEIMKRQESYANGIHLTKKMYETKTKVKKLP